VIADKNVPFPDMVGCADNAFFLHPLDDPRRPVVADLQVALHETCRCLAFLRDNRNRAVV